MSPGWEELIRALGVRPAVRVAGPVRSRAAVAMVLREGDPGLEALFIRRAEHPLDPWSGQMGFPGGRQDPEDPDLLATAVRETAEEVGIDLVRAGELLGGLDEVRAMARMRPLDLVISPFVFRLHGPAAPTLNPEVRSVHWIPLSALWDEGYRSTTSYELAGVKLRFPCVRWDGLTVWGLTYRMCSGLGERLRESAAGTASPAAG